MCQSEPCKSFQNTKSNLFGALGENPWRFTKRVSLKKVSKVPLSLSNQFFQAMNEEILQNINYRIDNALEYGRQIVEDEELIEQVERWREQTESFISKNPIMSVAAGLITGYVIGRIFRSED
jgi:ElaB/YqjD/DUF883 family membrane-anchored ribosome-binding protein